MQCESGWRWSVGIRNEVTHLIKINCSVSQELSVSHYLPHTTNLMAPHPHTALYTHACPKATRSLCAYMNACTRETRISSGIRQEQIKAENQSDDICSNQQVYCSFSVLWLNSACEKKKNCSAFRINAHHWLITFFGKIKYLGFLFNSLKCCLEPPQACKLSDVI